VKKGIYCLEVGEWFGGMKKKTSVEPILQLLHDSPLAVPYIHRDIATEVEFRYYLRKWTQSKQKEYPILYLAFHGNPGCIYLASTAPGLMFPCSSRGKSNPMLICCKAPSLKSPKTSRPLPGRHSGRSTQGRRICCFQKQGGASRAFLSSGSCTPRRCYPV
jgi:hypothetical protein